MTIRDLLDQGITIQGAYMIKRWNDAGDAFEVLASGEDFEVELVYTNKKKKVLDREMKYMYTEPLFGRAVESRMVIEVE